MFSPFHLAIRVCILGVAMIMLAKAVMMVSYQLAQLWCRARKEEATVAVSSTNLKVMRRRVLVGTRFW